MSEVRKTPVKINGQNGVIVHDKLCSDGPVDLKTGEPLIDPSTGEPYPGPNDDMAQLLHDYLVFLRSYDLSGNPRFGVLSLIALNTPIFVYDHPRFKKVANTAFTDGQHVFVDADFMRKLVTQEDASKNTQQGVIFLLLHELMHKLYYHVDRLQDVPPRIANIAEDLVINGKLIKGFKMNPVKLLSEAGFGMKPDEAEKYHNMAEEVVAEMLLIEERKKKQKQDKQEQGQQGQKQQGGGGGGGSSSESGESGEPGDEDENDSSNSKDKNQSKGNKPKDKDESKEKGGNKQGGGSGDEENEEEEYSPIHHISPEDLIKIVEEEGLKDSVGKALDLPDSDDIEGIGKKKDIAKLNDVDAIQVALSQAAKANGQYPGAHIAESAAELIGGLERGKISWKLGMRKHILGEGLKLRESDEEAALPWYLSKDVMGVDPWYSGALIPHAPDETVLCLVDTSGSTSGGNMRKEFLQEALHLKKGTSSMGDTAKEVILLSADTVLRGEPIIINETNVNKLQHEGVPIFGNGGTDFASCLNEALALPMMKKKKVRNVIYFTDCLDAPPTKEEFSYHIEKGIKFAFVTTPSMWNEKWNREVGAFAEVYCIEEGTVADLDKKDSLRDNNTRKNKM